MSRVSIQTLVEGIFDMSKLVHFRARWYDPATGRWLSPDPIGLEGGLNLYCFCGNDPVNYADPSGCSWWDEHVTDPLVNLVQAHWNRNRGLNDSFRLPPSPQVADDKKWQKLSLSESVYHNRYGACNTKYVSPDGHQEAVYDSCGNLVTDPINGGTYNKYGPDNWLGHFFYDMLPYYLFGNSPVDAFDHWDRVKATYESIQYSLEPLQSMLQELKRKVGL